MRLLRLDLIAFGPFTGVPLDFSAASSAPGLHIIYGPNEAGKTTARRALRTALYGFRHQVEFAFVHDKSALRVGLTIEDAQNRRLSFIRRRGNKRTLLAEDGLTELADDALAPYLDGAGAADDFERSFAIGAAELRAGGEAILRGEGDLSELLFMTAAGLPRLRSIERELSAAADALFLPSGQKPPINDAIARWKKLQAAADEKSLRPAEFVRHREVLRLANAERRQIEADLAERRGRQARLERVRQALHPAGRLRECRAELALVADAPLLPDDFTETRQRLETDRQIIASRLSRLREELEQDTHEAAELTVPDELLAASAEIARLYKRVGSYEQAVADSPQRLAEAAQFERDAGALLREVRPDLDLSAAESLRLTRPHREAIRESAGRRRELLAGQKKLEISLRRLGDESAAAIAELEGRGPEPSTQRLRDALRRAARDGDLDAGLVETASERDRLRRQVTVGLPALSLWQGEAADLAGLPTPPASTIDRFDTELTALAAEAKQHADRRIEVEQRLRTVEHELARLVRGSDVPTEDALDVARQRRDALWREVRRELEGEPAGTERASLTADADSLPAAFESASRSSDDAADRLRREADRVQQFLNLSDECDRLRADVDRHAAQERELRDRRQQMLKEWAACWPFLSAEPHTPREMREWSTQRDALARLFEEFQSAEARAADLAGRHEARCRELVAAIVETSGTTPASESSLGRLVERAERTLCGLDAAAKDREALRETIERNARNAANEESAAGSDRAELAELQRKWADQMVSFRLSPEASPNEAEAFLAATGEMFDKLRDAAALRERVEQMNLHRDRFAADMREMSLRFAPDLADRPAEEAATRLNEWLVEAQSDRQRRRDLVKRQEKSAAELSEKQSRADEIDAKLAVLCRQAGCGEPAELPTIEERSARRRALENRTDETEEELRRYSGGRSVDEFLVELDETEIDSIVPELKQLDDQIAELDGRLAKSIHEIGGLDHALSAMQGDSAAADAAEEAEAVLATLAADVERYVRLRLAVRLLREGRERYRKKSGNAVLDHASDLLARLTCGAFEGLKVDFGENDEPTLLGVRSGNREPVRPDGMSDGTADQLYLALRLAGLHAWLDKHEPLPFVVDDLLINFDDARAAAALETLAELSRRTQVLFFTHHEHLVRLAEAAVPDDVLHLHDLNLARGSALDDLEPVPANGRSKPSLF